LDLRRFGRTMKRVEKRKAGDISGRLSLESSDKSGEISLGIL